MKKTYNKLVRDRIVEIIESKGQHPEFEHLDEEKYLQELHKKLFEEANEFVEADDIEELADLFEVIYAIAGVKKIDLKQIEKIRLKKRKERGGFDEKVFLKSVEE